MSLDIEIKTNDFSVQEAGDHTTAGELPKIKERAAAIQIAATSETAEAEDSIKKVSSGDFGVIADIGAEMVAPGAKHITTLAGFVEDRLSTNTSSESPKPAGKSLTADDGAVSVRTSTYGGDPKTAKSLSGNSTKGLFERASIAKSSLCEPDSVGLHNPDPRGTKSAGEWKVDQAKMQGIQKAKELCFAQTVSKHAYESALRQERRLAPVMGMGGPSMAMKLTPRNVSGLMSDVKDNQDEARV